jgi:hypothetical protein
LGAALVGAKEWGVEIKSGSLRRNGWIADKRWPWNRWFVESASVWIPHFGWERGNRNANDPTFCGRTEVKKRREESETENFKKFQKLGETQEFGNLDGENSRKTTKNAVCLHL